MRAQTWRAAWASMREQAFVLSREWPDLLSRKAAGSAEATAAELRTWITDERRHAGRPGARRRRADQGERYLDRRAPDVTKLQIFGEAAESLVTRWADNGHAPQAAASASRPRRSSGNSRARWRAVGRWRVSPRSSPQASMPASPSWPRRSTMSCPRPDHRPGQHRRPTVPSSVRSPPRRQDSGTEPVTSPPVVPRQLRHPNLATSSAARPVPH